jgi:hypothetical protein
VEVVAVGDKVGLAGIADGGAVVGAGVPEASRASRAFKAIALLVSLILWDTREDIVGQAS